MYNAWRQRSLSIMDFGFLKKEMEQVAQRKPAKLLRDYREYMESVDKVSATTSTAGGKGKKGKKKGSNFIDLE